VAIVPAGDIVEDVLGPLAVGVDQVAQQLGYRWVHGYVTALARARVRSVVIFVSSEADTPRRIEVEALPAAVWILPEPRTAAAARRIPVRSRSLPARLFNAPFHRARPYLGTPVRGVEKVIRDEGCTAILCQEYEIPRFDVCALVIGPRTGVPVFVKFGGLQHTSTRFERVVRRFSTRRAARFLVSSPSEAERVRSRYRVEGERIAPLPHPIDTSFWKSVGRAEARADLGIAPGTQMVAWHGRVELGTKGLDILLAAWEQVVRHSPGGARQLWLWGTGEDAAELRPLVERAKPKTVLWRDEFVTDAEQVRALLSAADVYVIPSRREGLPLAALEAMACGLPVVTTATANISGFLDAAEPEGAGTVAEPEARAMALALERLLDDEALRARAGRLARARVVDNYDVDVIGPKLAAALTTGSR